MEVHIVLSPDLLLRSAHDVGESLEQRIGNEVPSRPSALASAELSLGPAQQSLYLTWRCVLFTWITNGPTRYGILCVHFKRLSVNCLVYVSGVSRNTAETSSRRRSLLVVSPRAEKLVLLNGVSSVDDTLSRRTLDMAIHFSYRWPSSPLCLSPPNSRMDPCHGATYVYWDRETIRMIDARGSILAGACLFS